MKTLIPVLALSALLCGCAGMTVKQTGRAVGNATYLAYEGVAAHQGEEFRRKVEELWARVNALESVEQMIVEFPPLKEAFDAVIACPELSDQDRAALVHIRDLVVKRVVDDIGEDVEWSRDAVDFLAAVRDGVNEMAEIYGRGTAAEQ